MLGFLRIAAVVAPVAAALMGIVGTGYAGLSNRVDALQVQSGMQQQATTDIDARLTRIENKLDAVLAPSAPAKVLH